MNLLNNFIKKLINQSFYKRRIFLILIDLFLFYISLSLTNFIFNGNTLQKEFDLYHYYLFSLVIGIPIYFLSGQYRALTKYAGSKIFYILLRRNIILFCSISLFSAIFFKDYISFKFNFLFIQILLSFEIFSKLLLRDLLRLATKSEETKKVLIYGAGEAGAALAASLELTGLHKIIAFVDDDSSLWGRQLFGTKIYSKEIIKKKISEIDQILLAIPSLSRNRRRKILNSITNQNIPILQIPSINDLAEGKLNINSLKPINIEDLLGRDKAPPDPKLLSKAIKKEVVCITGAGGSIGSEICKKVLDNEPEKIILVDNSEPSLYSIHKKLTALNNKNIKLIPILASVCNEKLMIKHIKDENISVIFHAAAYKHVPLVEQNPLEGIKNNSFGTLSLCKAAFKLGIKNITLISTDKAVRPTSCMGASKRLAELIFTYFSNKNKKDKKTIFSMVRFGNVLNSSGSVVPLFKEQIETGGPITLTHPDVVRYFMTMEEAAELVIQSSALANGGDIFLLDMGEALKIFDLAIKMIKLSGNKLKNKENPEGDIEIINIGLRTGEKLYEELLVSELSEKTKHPLIYRSLEDTNLNNDFIEKINSLEIALKQNNHKKVISFMKSFVPEWKRFN